jgi:ectoine hydroxylase-related dioxygenase (phytanoyl-CoA dioxygenase family)
VTQRVRAGQNADVITRTLYLSLRNDQVPAASVDLEQRGYAVLPGVFDAEQVAELRADIDRVFEEFPPDVRAEREAIEHWLPFRYEMLNRSEVCQRAIAHRAILEVVEPLLGEDCHVIANTAWRQPPEESSHGGRYWHIDSGPHVPRPSGVPWDERIPYPVFAVATHIMLMDCPIEAGPTAVLPGSHKSGQAPPLDRLSDDALTWEGQGALPLLLDAGDVALFVSDAWHHRLPSKAGDPGRYFLQCHYGRRDLAQRLRPTSESNQLSSEAAGRARTERERTLIGLHAAFFYDG